MTQTTKIIVVVLAAGLTCACLAQDQESPSLGEVARQTRQRTPPNKDNEKSNPARKSRKVVTDEDLPEHSSTSATPANEDATGTIQSAASDSGKLPPEQWTALITAQKSLVSRLQSDT